MICIFPLVYGQMASLFKAERVNNSRERVNNSRGSYSRPWSLGNIGSIPQMPSGSGNDDECSVVTCDAFETGTCRPNGTDFGHSLTERFDLVAAVPENVLVKYRKIA